MTAFYSDNDPYCAEWLGNLVAAEHIAPGRVDARDVRDLGPKELDGFDQCHFFAGIGGWSYALRLAGWPDDRPVWTGSCPCQPFSLAGRRKGHADDRHLWPAWSRLIRQCKPVVVFGEQVAGADGLAWIDAVCADLENIGYAVAAVDFPAAGIGAPHIRQRLFFVADAGQGGRAQFSPSRIHERWAGASGEQAAAGNTDRPRRNDAHGCGAARDFWSDASGGLANAQGMRRAWDGWNQADESSRGTDERRSAGHWAACDWIACRDGKARPVEPGAFPLAYRAPGRVGRLRAYGNAIVPQAAAAVIRAYMEVSACSA